jgi:hypothetical protein
MSFPQDEIDELKPAFTGLSMASEGGADFISIPSLKLPKGCDPSIVDALLRPTARDGYPSRLYLATRVSHQGKGQHWNTDQIILGRRWFAVSWKTQGANSRLAAILAGHLEAFRCASN